MEYLKSNTNGKHPPKLIYSGKEGLLFQGDSLSLLSKMASNSVNMVFADPPFNLGKIYDNDAFADTLENKEYMKWCKTWLLQAIRVLKPGGALFLYHWPKMLMEIGSWLNTLKTIEYRSWIALTMKSGFPIKNRLHPAHYGILYYTKKGEKPTFNIVRSITPTCRHCGGETRDYGGYRSKFVPYEDEDGIPWIQISDFWEDTHPARHEKSRQITVVELPLLIPERLILMASKAGDTILDIFGGSGSTYHAAQLHKRHWIGCDVGDVTNIIRRLKLAFNLEITKSLDPKLKACFKPGFITRGFGRYISERGYSLVDSIEPSTKSAKHIRDYKSKSRIINKAKKETEQ
jgi:site-specific DNA-methyltransferase (adenine-specific)